jgi:hypothetical protein
LGEKWGGKYAIGVKSWEKNWDDLTTFFDFPADIRRIIYTTNTAFKQQSGYTPTGCPSIAEGKAQIVVAPLEVATSATKASRTRNSDNKLATACHRFVLRCHSTRWRKPPLFLAIDLSHRF